MLMREYRLDKFQENHNHYLEDTFHFKSTRTLSYSDKVVIFRVSTVNIVDYINFKRDMGFIIWFRDAQLIMNKMNDKENNYLSYSLIVMKIRFWMQCFGQMKRRKHTTMNLWMLYLLMQPFVQTSKFFFYIYLFNYMWFMNTQYVCLCNYF